MRGYAVTSVFAADAVAMHAAVSVLVADLPEYDELRCHELARAVAKLFNITAVDGKYGAVEHSWCRYNRTIVDPYCPGRVPMVQLIDCSWQLPHAEIYVTGNRRTDIDETVVTSLLERMSEHAAYRRFIKEEVLCEGENRPC